MSPSVHLFAFNTVIAAELKGRVARLNLPPTHPDYLAPRTNPSPYQQAVFAHMKKPRSLIVRAVAGSGKTDTCVHSLKHIPGIDLSKVRASTFHSVGFGAVAKKLNVKKLEPDSGKVIKLAKQALGEDEYDLYGAFCARLVGLAKGQGVGCLVPDVEDVWYGLITHHDLYLEDERAEDSRAVAIAKDLLRRSNEAAKQGSVDFDDLLYLPLLWRLRLWQNDVVFVDEAQDTNPVRRAIAKLALRPGGKLVAVGDERQAIYGFTGASHDALDLIRQEFDCEELPLTVSYRCPKSVGEKAKELVPYFEVADGAKEGSVENLPLKEALKVLTAHDAILCRQTRPLFELAFKLIASGTGCAILGRDIAKGLTDLIKKRNASGLPNLVSKLEVFRDREVARFIAKGEEGKAESIEDRVACVLTVVDNLPEAERTVPGLIRKLEGLFTDTNGVLLLSTVHKAKGREWENVAILEPELVPSKWARQEWQMQQERNLMYVAWTRTMGRLLFLTTTEVK
jgi:DNA helicase-2/ATP-dependent DNA helicase PcrA